MSIFFRPGFFRPGFGRTVKTRGIILIFLILNHSLPVIRGYLLDNRFYIPYSQGQ